MQCYEKNNTGNQGEQKEYKFYHFDIYHITLNPTQKAVTPNILTFFQN